MDTELKRTTIFLTKGQHEELRKMAFTKRKSMSSLLRDAVIEMLEDEEDIRDSIEAMKEEGSISYEDYLKERK